METKDTIVRPPGEGENITPEVVEPKTALEMEENAELRKDSGMGRRIGQFLDIKKDDIAPPKEEDKGTSTPPKEEEVVPPVVSELDKMEQPQLIEEVKKNQRLVSERETNIKKLEDEVQRLKNIGEGEDPESKKLQAFIQEMKEDFTTGYSKFRKEYDLPDISVVQAQMNKGTVPQRVKHWQDTTLRSKIEKQFGLEEGEFEFSMEDAAKADTASYEWLYQTKLKEGELIDADKKVVQSQAQLDQRLEQQRELDKKSIAEKFYDGDLEKVKDLTNEMNTIANKVASGELTPDQHPLSLFNIARGVRFDELAGVLIKNAVDDIVKQFAEKGMVLEGDLPTDISKVSGSPSSSEEIKPKTNYSPMARGIKRFTK